MTWFWRCTSFHEQLIVRSYFWESPILRQMRWMDGFVSTRLDLVLGAGPRALPLFGWF